MTIRILTWNLQGRERPDLDAVAGLIRERRPDVVVLQEVQRRQASVLAEELAWEVEWRFKHWPIVFPAEGLAILTPVPVRTVRTVRLAGGLRFWSWRRRIAIVATVSVDGTPLTLVDTHLGAGVGSAERVRQARRTMDLVGTGLGVVAGDLNTHPGSAVLDAYAARGFRDAWHDLHPGRPGPTNWPPGPRTGPPMQRLDYVLVTPGLRAEAADLPAHGETGFDRFGALSDHLPLLAEITVTGFSGGRGPLGPDGRRWLRRRRR